jgi:hypothetical protein
MNIYYGHVRQQGVPASSESEHSGAQSIYSFQNAISANTIRFVDHKSRA